MKKKVLLIDDDELILRSLTSLFIKQGWDITAKQNGRDGLEEIKKQRYDCVLLDMRMPEMTGPEVMAELRSLESSKQLPSQKVIIITGYADEEAAIQAFQLGAFHYVTKPFDIEVLLEKVNSAIISEEVGQVFEEAPDIDVLEKQFKKIRKNYDKESLDKKVDYLESKLNLKLKHIRACSYSTESLKGNIENPLGISQIPISLVGPLLIDGKNAKGDFFIPLSTTEGALSLTYDLGARLLRMSGPIKTEVVSKGVHITPMFPIYDDEDKKVSEFVDKNYEELKKVAEGGSNHTKLLRIEKKKSARNLLLKFVYDTGDAQGLNMINQASFNACKYIQAKTNCNFYHRSHYSGIKHFSPLNEKEGQGRVVKASGIISSKALGMLRVKADKMKDFFDRCIESATVAGINSVNVHAANGITAMFLACGQDLADVSCSHSCSTTVDIVNEKDLKIEVTLHNLMIATVGGGTGLGTQRECLSILDCLGSGKSDKFAEIVAATVLAGEFPTAGAVITETYVDIHNKYGRNRDKVIRD